MKAIFRTLTYCKACAGTTEHVRQNVSEQWACCGCKKRRTLATPLSIDKRPKSQERLGE